MSKVYDLNRIRKTYPLVRRKPIYSSNLSLSQSGVQVETAILNYNDEFTKTYAFTQQYSQIPVIAATPEDENVNIFITSLTVNGVTIESSASFVGKVHLQIFEEST